jgi:site-specific DNA recombinase
VKNGENNTLAVRCAIYTRKSTNEGLGQDFNSLDAQRESAEAYIASQKHEGWVCLPTLYDDGGYSGGNMARPALIKLLVDVEAGRIDCIVVYKVDRLSRSLLDFANIISMLDKHDVSFVSVTQQFNTTTSMGRLTLNILLSFAQFEREITSERTRDKIRAARRKGKWIGGHPVLGYDLVPEGGRIVVNEKEAEQVRAIFELYARHKALLSTLKAIKRRGWRNKSWVTRKNHTRGGGPFSKPTLRRLLSNVLYIGKVTLADEEFEGEHDAIVDKALWDQVQSILRRNTRKRRAGSKPGEITLLGGILRCARCETAMTNQPVTKGKRRYRYYVCTNSIKNGRGACPNGSVPAQQVEDFVVARLMERGCDNNESPMNQILTPFCRVWQRSSPADRREAFRQVVSHVIYDGTEGQLKIQVRKNGAQESAGRPDAPQRPEYSHDGNSVIKSRFYFRRGPYGQKRMTTGVEPAPPAAPDRIPRVSRLMALAIRFDKLISSSKVKDYADLARLGHVTRARITQIMNLLNLAPDIQEKILFLPRVKGGRDPFTIRHLQPIATETDWQKQRGLWPRL